MGLPIPEGLAGTTQALFYEFRHQSSSDIKPPYTLKEYDWEGCKSMYQIYMAYDTEYDAAMAILGSWYHWKRLCKCKWFITHKEEWDAEKEIRKQSLGEKALIAAAKEGNVTAATTLYKSQGKAKGRGRPVNHEEKKDDHTAEVIKMAERVRSL